MTTKWQNIFKTLTNWRRMIRLVKGWECSRDEVNSENGDFKPVSTWVLKNKLLRKKVTNFNWKFNFPKWTMKNGKKWSEYIDYEKIYVWGRY